MWADKESRLDYLNFSDIAEAAVDVICNPTMAAKFEELPGNTPD